VRELIEGSERNSTWKGRNRLASRRLAICAAHLSTNSNTESPSRERSNETKRFSTMIDIPIDAPVRASRQEEILTSTLRFGC